MTAEQPWVPRASCDASCVTRRRRAAGQRVVVAWRVAMRATFAVLLLSATPLLAIPVPGRSHVQRGYCRLMLRCLGVRITVSGGPIRNLQGVLVVSGHVSWVDIFAIGSVMPGRFVAKSELINWPGLGIAGAPDEGHPDRAGQPAAPARRGRARSRAGCARARRSSPSPRAPPGAAWRTARSGLRCSRPPSTRAGRSSRCG